jgi:hypothetical protein
VGADADPLGSRRQEREVGQRVEHRDVGRDRRVVASVDRAAQQVGRQHEVLGDPHRVVAQLVGGDGDVDPGRRVELTERDRELHEAGSPLRLSAHPSGRGII